MEERSISGTFKSLSNFMSDLSDRSMASRQKYPQDGAIQMWQITDDYNALLKQATDEIKALTKAREQDCHQSDCTGPKGHDTVITPKQRKTSMPA